MARYVAFLRAVNLGGHRSVKKEQLCSCFEELGFEEVATFRASGNVVFAAGGGTAAKITARLEAGLAKSLGYEVPVLLRSAAQVRAITRHRPFGSKLVGSAGGKLQVALLLDKPSPAAREMVLAMASEDDRLAIRGRELYWLPAAGVGRSALDLKTVEAAVGPWTMRTMGTIEEIATRYGS